MRITLKSDTIRPDLQKKIKALSRPRSVYEAGAKAVQKGISAHLKKLQASGNEMGWPSQGFFAGSKNSVEKNVGISKLTDQGAIITIADPRFVHRITGGTVRPKRRKFLAIPLTAAAYALAGQGSIRTSAPGLKVFGKRKLYLAVEKGDRIELWFALVKSVTHRPHPEDAPDEAVLAATAGSAMTRAADLLLEAKR